MQRGRGGEIKGFSSYFQSLFSSPQHPSTPSFLEENKYGIDRTAGNWTPEGVDVCLVEGGIANEENLELIREVRAKTKLLISFGDCAVTANVPAMWNMLGGAEPVLKRCYLELSDGNAQLPHLPGIVPELLDRVRPVHEVVPVDMFLPGCPPSADRIQAAIAPVELLLLHF